MFVTQMLHHVWEAAGAARLPRVAAGKKVFKGKKHTKPSTDLM